MSDHSIEAVISTGRTCANCAGRGHVYREPHRTTKVTCGFCGGVGLLPPASPAESVPVPPVSAALGIVDWLKAWKRRVAEEGRERGFHTPYRTPDYDEWVQLMGKIEELEREIE